MIDGFLQFHSIPVMEYLRRTRTLRMPIPDPEHIGERRAVGVARPPHRTPRPRGRWRLRRRSVKLALFQDVDRLLFRELEHLPAAAASVSSRGAKEIYGKS